MSDFAELCPLFSTGVFNELVFPNVHLTDCTLCGNVLRASIAAMASTDSAFTFGRTVIVTNAWLKKRNVNESAVVAVLQHHTSGNAVGTIFASLTVSVSVTGQTPLYAWIPMTVTEKTFTSSEVLGLAALSVVVSAGSYDLMIRYKEK
jgi:hypothetical protein